MMDDAGWKSVLAELGNELAKIIPAVRDVPDKPLYHYTGSAGLIGILESGCQWLTHFKFLNDPQEIEGGEALVGRVLDALAQSSNPGTLEKCFFEKGAGIYREGSIAKDNIFVASFSELGDDLGQWRAYGADGEGYSIGIKFNVVDREGDPSRDAMIVRCCYDTSGQRDQIEEVARRGAEALAGFASVYACQREDENQAIVDLLQHCTVHLLVALANRSIRYKNPDFRAEQEWRVYQLRRQSISDVKFRSSGSHVIPYVSAELLRGEDPSTLHEICIGPTHDAEQRATSVRMLVDRCGLSCNVRRSDIRFRR